MAKLLRARCAKTRALPRGAVPGRWMADGKSKVYGYSSSQSNLPHRCGNSHAIQNHTVLPATRQRWPSRVYPSRSWYSIKRPGVSDATLARWRACRYWSLSSVAQRSRPPVSISITGSGAFYSAPANCSGARSVHQSLHAPHFSHCTRCGSVLGWIVCWTQAQ